jgi:hypothetical protein
MLTSFASRDLSSDRRMLEHERRQWPRSTHMCLRRLRQKRVAPCGQIDQSRRIGAMSLGYVGALDKTKSDNWCRFR